MFVPRELNGKGSRSDDSDIEKAGICYTTLGWGPWWLVRIFEVDGPFCAYFVFMSSFCLLSLFVIYCTHLVAFRPLPPTHLHPTSSQISSLVVRGALSSSGSVS